MTDTSVSIEQRLVTAGLRPTRQRMIIAGWLFAGTDKHFTAEDVHNDMLRSENRVSLATIYNTLGTFTEAGLLHTVNAEAGRVFYDTNTRPHYHIYDAQRQHLTDIDVAELKMVNMPTLPNGQEIEHIDVIIRTKQSGT